MMNTKIAQILVGMSKGTKIGLLSLVFTFVFLGMSIDSNAQAQSIGTSNSSLDLSVLDNYAFKKDRAYVINVLEDLRQNGSGSSLGEVYEALHKHFICDLITRLKDQPNVVVKDAVRGSYLDLASHSYYFKDPSTYVRNIVNSVSAQIN